jgi:hypothetical protein
LVLDVDPRNGGDEALRAVQTEHAILPTTLTSRTGGGGNHSCELECVEALTAEVEKARRLLASYKPGTAHGCLTTGIDKGHRRAG